MKLEQLTSEQWNFIIDHPEQQKQGVHIYYKDCPYPYRMYFSYDNDPNFHLRALHALGTVKKFLFSLTYLPTLVLPYRLSFKKYELFLSKIERTCWWPLNTFYPPDNGWTVPVWEIGKFIRLFLENLGFKHELAVGYSKLCMCILEYDNAYRFRVQDMFEVHQNLIYYFPSLCVKEMLKLYKARESNPGAAEKIYKIGGLLKWILKIPKIKKAWIKAMNEVDVPSIRFDKNDKFHFSFWKGYDYEGKTFEQRFTPYEELYKTIPFKKRPPVEQTINFMTETK